MTDGEEVKKCPEFGGLAPHANQADLTKANIGDKVVIVKKDIYDNPKAVCTAHVVSKNTRKIVCENSKGETFEFGSDGRQKMSGYGHRTVLAYPTKEAPEVQEALDYIRRENLKAHGR